MRLGYLKQYLDLDNPFAALAHFDSTWLLLSLIPSGVGLVLFMYGKKRDLTPHKVAGVLYMAYPIVATTVTSLLVGGALIGLGLWYAIRADW